MIVECFLGIARPAHEPPHVARRERIGVLGTKIARWIEGAVGDHHLHRHTAAGDGGIKFVGKLHADARTSGEHTRAAGSRAVRDAQLRMFAIGHDVLGVEFSVGHHLRQSHHRCRVWPDGVGRDHVDIGVLGGLRRRDAAVYPNGSLFYFCSRWHGSLRF